MEINPLLALTAGWVLGLLIGWQTFSFEGELPSLMGVWGFILLAGISSTFYFGKGAPIMMVALGILESGLVHTYPLAGGLLGITTIGAGLYGKTLGFLALEDFYENGETRLPGMSVGAVLNMILILLFGMVVWFLFSVLPTAAQLTKWIPLPGLGV